MEDDPPLATVVRDGKLLCTIEEAALVLARQEYFDLDPAVWMARLDPIADRVRSLTSTEPDAAEAIGAVSDVLFRELGFRGNMTDYTDPRNSFLNDVLERGLGIPITLSILYIAVARRVGCELYGTNFPGHFLIVHPRADWPIVVDAFDGGRILSRRDCEHLARHFGAQPSADPPEPAADLVILRRMLENLRHIYMRVGDRRRLLRTAVQILAVTPEDRTVRALVWRLRRDIREEE